MKQWTTVLVTRQDDLSRVYEARKQKVTFTRGPLTLLTTEKNKYGWVNGIVRLIEDQKAQMETNNDETKTTSSITFLENDRVEITVFLLIYHLAGSANESPRPSAAIVPVTAAGGCCYEDRQRAHARKITASLRSPSESLCGTSLAPTRLEDLQWTDRPIDESYRRHFLETFTSFNEVLRARGNYYAARTSRYTTVQSRLTPCIAVRCNKRKCQAVEDPSRSFETQRLKNSQTYRIILPDVISNESSRISEMESLRKENERLSRALRRAAELHLSMLTEAEATHKEKEKLAEERRALEDERRNLQAKREELRCLEECRNSIVLKENERLTEERSALETAKQEFRLQRKEFKRLSAEDRRRLREKERHLEETRRGLDLERQKFSARQVVFERFNAANSSSLMEEIASLEDQRQSLDQERHNVAMDKEGLGTRYEIVASGLRDQEILAKRQRQRLERDQRVLAEHSERFKLQETASATSWREKEASLEEQRRVLERFKEELIEKKRDFEEYCENRSDNLRDKEESLKAQRRNLERDTRRLSERENELVVRQNAARHTPPKVIVKKESVSFVGGRTTDEGVKNDLSRVYEARKRKVSNMKNPLTFLTTEKTKFNGWINGIAKLIEDQKAQMERNNDESKTTYLITSLENGQVKITAFLLIHNLAGLTNENGRPTVTIIPAPAARGCCYEDRGSAHAWKITASLHNQSEWVCGNSTSTETENGLKRIGITDKILVPSKLSIQQPIT